MSDLFYEIKESFEQERIEKFLKIIRYPFLIISIIALIGATAFSIIKSNKLAKIHQDAKIYTEILYMINNGYTSLAIEKVDELINNGSLGYRTLSLILKSKIETQNGNFEKAKNHLAQIKLIKKYLINFITSIETVNFSLNKNDVELLTDIVKQSNHFANICKFSLICYHILDKNSKEVLDILNDKHFVDFMPSNLITIIHGNF
ncbi:hypothetical protein [Candidatus Gromoviella agglomerans]|uniref:hypothetical protein n=1 Tax=Candidatus Gromoviella agglomerans TaxID=2806609 RepID=UPI001E4EA144|nr:hypothetical protein [Candidatus Gromoviella agglomerans]UFX98509.1 hypothetical protein Gromo_00419 [Candidatus Gromoviella agglomerans]